MLLQDRVVIVTGGAQPRSIGEAIAQRVLEEGARTIVTSRSAEAAAAAAKRLSGNGRVVVGETVDLTSDDDVERLATRVLRDHGRVDGIVHNAGARVTEWERGLLDVRMEEFAHAFDVDVLGALRLTRRLLPSMVERRAGSILLTSSTAALAGYEHLHEFAPAKAAVLGVVRSLTAEFGRHNIRANALAYGNISSPATYDALTPEMRHSLAEETPMRRWGTPREAAGASVFLLSDLASFVNGQVLIVDGGAVMR